MINFLLSEPQKNESIWVIWKNWKVKKQKMNQKFWYNKEKYISCYYQYANKLSIRVLKNFILFNKFEKLKIWERITKKSQYIVKK